MRLYRALATTALVTAGLLSSAASANAATRYAVPGSSVTTGVCDNPVPGCRLDHAINSAAAIDTVIVKTGQYDVTWPISPNNAVTIEGEAGQPRPRLLGDAGLAGPTIDLSRGGSVKHVYVESKSTSPALNTKEVAVSDVIAYATSGDAGFVKAGSGSVIRDSVFHTTAGAPYAALRLSDDQVTGPLDVVNVTAYGATAGSTGIENGAGGPVTIVNTIARGGTSDITRVSAVAFANVSYTNFRIGSSNGVTAGSGNSSGAPIFVNAAAGDFRPVLGSPTIDTGTSAVALQADPDGVIRGITPDVGAFEYVAPGGGGGGGGETGGGTGGTTTSGETTGTTSGGSTTTTTTDPGAKTGDSGTGTGTEGSGEQTTLPPEAPPVLGESVGLGPVKGSVTVTLPGSASPIALEQGASVPVGSVIDATEGTVALTSVRDKNGKTQTGQFWGGVFRVGQDRRDAYTELKLAGKLPSCTTRNRVTAAGRRKSRRLWGRDRGGRFRTRGRNGTATVRGTEWLTEDRCDGTFFRVTNGKILVRDTVHRKNVKLGRGDSYLAGARAAKRRR